MSATMPYGNAGCRPSRWICGVCADLADRAAVPVFMPRLAFAVFAVMHGFLACILYFGLAYLLSPSKRATARFRACPSPSPDFATASQRFRNLDERLCNLEAATVNTEAELRRAFRDLERRR
jgi:phage shock protein PspC (stress-responsive transcriptional regulator)